MSMFDMRKCGIDRMNTINDSTIRYLLVSSILLVGILFSISTIIVDVYDILYRKLI
jgi:hypothetical protein